MKNPTLTKIRETPKDNRKTKAQSYKTLSVPLMKDLCLKFSLLCVNSKIYSIESLNKDKLAQIKSKKSSTPLNVLKKTFDLSSVFLFPLLDKSNIKFIQKINFPRSVIAITIKKVLTKPKGFYLIFYKSSCMFLEIGYFQLE